MTETPEPGNDQAIVVGLDGSKAALRALEWAAAEALASDRGLNLVYVHPGDALAMTPFAQNPSERATEIFAAARDLLTVDGESPVSITETVRSGMARRALLRASRDAPMLVLGRQGTGRFTDVMLGSTALACAMHAQVPVTVVPETWDPYAPHARRILLGVDGSDRSESAAEYAFTLADERDMSLIAIHAVEPPSWYPVNDPHTVDPFVEDRATYQRVANTVFEASVVPWREQFPNVNVTTVAEKGHPAEAMNRHVNEADRIIIGGRGHGLVTGMLLGSIARSVLFRMPIPMTVIRDNL